MLWGDNVKDEEGYRAILSEARASASQMAVAKFLNTISMLPGVAGETRDAISACTQVKMIEAPRLLRSVSQWNKACDSICQVCQITSIKRRTTDNYFIAESDSRLQTWFLSRCSMCRRLAGFNINVRDFAERIWIHTRLFPFRRCSRNKPQFLTAVPSLKLFRWTLVYVCMVLPALQFGKCVLGTLSSKSAKVNFERHKRQGVNLSHSHSDNGVFDSIDRVPPQLCLVRRQCGSDPNVQQRTKPKPKARHKTARSRDFYWLSILF